jgi:hypothetical protein
MRLQSLSRREADSGRFNAEVKLYICVILDIVHRLGYVLKDTQLLGNWICLRHQVKVGEGGAYCNGDWLCPRDPSG